MTMWKILKRFKWLKMRVIRAEHDKIILYTFIKLSKDTQLLKNDSIRSGELLVGK